MVRFEPGFLKPKPKPIQTASSDPISVQTQSKLGLRLFYLQIFLNGSNRVSDGFCAFQTISDGLAYTFLYYFPRKNIFLWGGGGEGTLRWWYTGHTTQGGQWSE